MVPEAVVLLDLNRCRQGSQPAPSSVAAGHLTLMSAYDTKTTHIYAALTAFTLALYANPWSAGFAFDDNFAVVRCAVM